MFAGGGTPIPCPKKGDDKMKKTAWDYAPYLRREGNIVGTVIRIRQMRQADGCQLLLQLADTPQEKPQEPPGDIALPKAIFDRIYKERIDAEGAVKVGIYIRGWKESDDENETDIEDLLSHLRPGNRVRIRMSQNWRRKKFYCRFIENLDTMERSGWRREDDHINASHHYPYYPESIEAEFQILHIRMQNNYEAIYEIEISQAKPGCVNVYKCVSPSGTPAFSKIRSAGIEKTIHQKMICRIVHDPDTGKAILEDISTKDKIQKEKNEKEKSAYPKYDYAAAKNLADTYQKIPNAEYVEPGAYTAVTIENEETDYRSSSIRFIPLRLSDGREIMPEIRTDSKNTKEGKRIAEIARGKTDLIRNRKLLRTGMPVTIFLSPSQKGGYMLLRGIYSSASPDTLAAKKKDWLENAARS